MFSYVILSHDGFSGFQLVSSHMDGFGAWTAYRRAKPPCLLVRLDEVTGAEALILEAKGVDLDERPTDLRRAVRKVVNGLQSRRLKRPCGARRIAAPPIRSPASLQPRASL